jgi:hypothetical protein
LPRLANAAETLADLKDRPSDLRTPRGLLGRVLRSVASPRARENSAFEKMPPGFPLFASVSYQIMSGSAWPAIPISQTESMNSTASIYLPDQYILSKEMGYQPIHVGTMF